MSFGRICIGLLGAYAVSASYLGIGYAALTYGVTSPEFGYAAVIALPALGIGGWITWWSP